MTPLQHTILLYIRGEHAPLPLSLLVSDMQHNAQFLPDQWPELAELEGVGADVESAVLELVEQGKVRRLSPDVFEAVAENEWPVEKPKGLLFV